MTELGDAPPPERQEPGFYPDPLGGRRARYWDGTAWTDRTSQEMQQLSGGSAPTTALKTERIRDQERKAILGQQLQQATVRGLRIESQSDFQAALVEGQKVNHTLHAILTVFTCLLWGIVWAIIAGTGGERREMIVVDEFGNVQHQRLGKV